MLELVQKFNASLIMPTFNTIFEGADLVSLKVSFDGNLSSINVNIHLDTIFIFVVISILLISIILRSRFNNNLIIDEFQLGIGSQKIRLKTNHVDRQVAYKIWVELSTRKIGLPIDLDDDLVVEIYDSWYSFFGITRELIKSIPAEKMSRPSTKSIVDTSILLLNEGIRPHLTKWQARYRSWYNNHVTTNLAHEAPQDLQRRFDEFEALRNDLLAVNKKLIAYRDTMRMLFES